MRAVIPFSILLGFIWNMIAVLLMGGRAVDSFRWSLLVAGASAGLAAGLFTVWSRRRLQGEEGFFYGLANYYLAIFIYWLSQVVVERAWLCWKAGRWTNYELHDHINLLWVFLIHGTLWFGVILIPLTFLTRHLVWRLYQKFEA